MGTKHVRKYICTLCLFLDSLIGIRILSPTSRPSWVRRSPVLSFSPDNRAIQPRPLSNLLDHNLLWWRLTDYLALEIQICSLYFGVAHIVICACPIHILAPSFWMFKNLPRSWIALILSYTYLHYLIDTLVPCPLSLSFHRPLSEPFK